MNWNPLKNKDFRKTLNFNWLISSPVPFYEVGESSSQPNRIQDVVDLGKLPQLLGVVHTGLKQREFNNEKKYVQSKLHGLTQPDLFHSFYMLSSVDWFLERCQKYCKKTPFHCLFRCNCEKKLKTFISYFVKIVSILQECYKKAKISQNFN